MEDFFLQDGKIWVVIAVIASVFIGIVMYLIYLDKRLKKLENE
jgi:CcmD family protein